MKVKRSNYFIPFRKESEFEGAIDRMIRGGFIHQQSSGIYIWLALGLRMLEKIVAIIDEEHAKIGAQKILMPTLHEAALWKQSGRYQEYGDEMLKIFDRHQREFVFGPSAEEMFTNLLTKWPLNKNAFPMILYNIQWKFRDEIRPRFAILRSREFLMKDAYSFDKTEEEMMKRYEIMFNVYSSIFDRLGLNVCTFSSDVGIMGGNLSHEFLVKSDFGETRIKYNKWPTQPIKWAERDNAVLDEEAQEGDKYAEIGHIYALGDKYTRSFKALNPETQQPLQMGCYGIGVSRLVGVIFENNLHDLGPVAPFKHTLITMQNDEVCNNIAEQIFAQSDEIIWDDRDVSPGVKFAEADLIGSNIQIHIGKREAEQGKVIIKQYGQKTEMPVAEAMQLICKP